VQHGTSVVHAVAFVPSAEQPLRVELPLGSGSGVISSGSGIISGSGTGSISGSGSAVISGSGTGSIIGSGSNVTGTDLIGSGTGSIIGSGSGSIIGSGTGLSGNGTDLIGSGSTASQPVLGFTLPPWGCVQLVNNRSALASGPGIDALGRAFVTQIRELLGFAKYTPVLSIAGNSNSNSNKRTTHNNNSSEIGAADIRAANIGAANIRDADLTPSPSKAAATLAQQLTSLDHFAPASLEQLQIPSGVAVVLPSADGASLWELDALVATATATATASARRQLAALATMLDKMPNVVVPDGVARYSRLAVAALERADRLVAIHNRNGGADDITADHATATDADDDDTATDAAAATDDDDDDTATDADAATDAAATATASLTGAYVQAQKALRLATAALADPALLAVLYFPDEHKLAVYLPLTLPLLAPIVKNLVAAVKRKRAGK
jgi:hypothetical protein